MNSKQFGFLLVPVWFVCFALSLAGQANSGNTTTLRNWKFSYPLKSGDTVGGVTIQEFAGVPVCDPALTQCLIQFVAQDGVGTLYTARMFFNGSQPVLVAQMPHDFYRAQMSDSLVTAITGDDTGIGHLYYLTPDNRLVGPILNDGDYLGGQIGTVYFAGTTNITPNGKILTNIGNNTELFFSVYNQGQWQPFSYITGDPTPDPFSLGVSNQKGCGTIHFGDPYGNFLLNMRIGCMNLRDGQITMPPFPFVANGQTYTLDLPVTF